ncbi:hypothetical protein BS47DRAFT_1320085 [Hydnum rufescens UP504]|uniref:Ion transport domain-containing protein n=1 Tax=Hydnum rufescens UP504 TaxID=1448309 RepID=A0A9P6AQT0_9AGAM|nr:hypothetical protein BS47DRAFT_1320085 [Hydnum rufescens UP504]
MSIPLTAIPPGRDRSGRFDSIDQSDSQNEEEVSDNGTFRPQHPNALRSTLFESADPNEPDSVHSPLRHTLFDLLENPTSSSAAFLVHVFSTSLIIISALVTVIETLRPFHKTPSLVWFGLETALVVCFTVEYMCRCFAHSETWRGLWDWLRSFFALVDLLAILPYYIEIAVRADTTAFFRFSILRTFRLLRVFRPFRYSNTILLTIEVMYLSMKRSKEALLALGFFVLMAVIVFSTLLYFAERGVWDDALETFVDSDGDPSKFESIPAAAWFVLVTISTVGYGETVPRTFLGRLITLPLLIFGLLVIALPSFVLGREFSAIWEGMMLRGQMPTRTHSDSISEFLDAQAQARLPSRRGRHARQEGSGDPESSSAAVFGESSVVDGVRAGLLHGGITDDDPSGATGLTNRKLARNQQVLSKQIEEIMVILQGIQEKMGVDKSPPVADS